MESEGSNSSGEDEAHNWVPKFNKRFGQGYLCDVARLGDLGKSESSTNLDELAENVRAAEADNQPTRLVNNESTVNQPALDASLNPESSRAEGDLYDVVRNYLEALGKPQSSLNLDELPVNVRAAEGKNKSFDEISKDSQQGENNLDRTFTLGEMMPQQNQIPTRQQKNTLPVFMPGHPVQQPTPGAESMMMDTIMASFLMGSLSDTQNQESSARARERRQKRMVLIKEAKPRAKEGAYLQELESKLPRLKLENERLKHKVAEMLLLLPSEPASEGRYQLRRTSSSPI